MWTDRIGPEALVLLYAAAILTAGAAWGLLLAGGVRVGRSRAAGDRPPGWRRLCGGAAAGALGAAGGVGAMAVGGLGRDWTDLFLPLVLLVAFTQAAAALLTAAGLRAAWRCVEGWHAPRGRGAGR